MTIALVSCVKTKAPVPMPAKDLYISNWFVMARRYAEQNADRWFILSAVHGLVHPNMLLAPYEHRLDDMCIADRRAWADKVKTQIEGLGELGDKAIVLAGLTYRVNLMPFLHKQFRKVEVPMRGLPQGRQLQFLKDSTRNPT
jgi:hypothetical protein